MAGGGMTAVLAESTLRSVTVVGSPRLHFGLLDLGDATPRRYGGAGCLIGAPGVRVTAHPDERWSFTGLGEAEARTRTQVYDLLGRLERLPLAPRRVAIERAVPEHIGLGSKTTTLLSIAHAAS